MDLTKEAQCPSFLASLGLRTGDAQCPVRLFDCLRPPAGIEVAFREPTDDKRQIRLNPQPRRRLAEGYLDRKSTRLNSSHVRISYAVFCLKKKKINHGNCSDPALVY